MYSYLRFAKHTFLIGALNVLGIIQGLALLPIITKILGAEDYGVWTQLRVTISLLVSLAFLGLCASLRRFIPGEKDGEKIQEGTYSSLVFVLGVSLVMAVFMIIFSESVAAFLQFSETLVKLLSLTIIFESLGTVLLTVMLSKREVEKYFWFAVLKMVGETGLIIGAIFLGYGLYGVVFASLLIRIVIFLISLVYTVGKIGVKIPNFSLIKDYLSFGLPTIADGISYWVVTSVDRYIIGLFLGMLFVGYYAPAYSLGMLLVFFIVPIMSVLPVVLPKFFDENNFDEVKRYLSYSLKYFLLIMVPAAIGLSILSRELLVVLSTEEIAANAHLVVPLIAASIFVYGIICFFGQILILFKKTKLIAIIWMIAAFLNFGLNIIFTPRFGIMAAAIITLTSYLCAFVLLKHFANKELKFKIDWNFKIKIGIASISMAIFLWWVNPRGLMNIMLAIVWGVVIYGVLILLLRGVGKKEIGFLRGLIVSSFEDLQIKKKIISGWMVVRPFKKMVGRNKFIAKIYRKVKYVCFVVFFDFFDFVKINLFIKIYPYTMCGYFRLSNSYEAAKRMERDKVIGSFVECGVWKGGCSAIMGFVADRAKSNRKIWLFDSFEGLPEPTDKDGQRAKDYARDRSEGKLETIDKCVGTLKDVNKIFFEILKINPKNIIINKGWFQDSLPKIKGNIGPISILRINGDWYESNKCCLDNLYDSVVPGGHIMIDDYGYWEGTRLAVRDFFKERKINPSLIKIDCTAVYFKKPG